MSPAPGKASQRSGARKGPLPAAAATAPIAQATAGGDSALGHIELERRTEPAQHVPQTTGESQVRLRILGRQR